MKIYRTINLRALTLATTCLLLVSGYNLSEARIAASTGHTIADPVRAPARLIIRRVPNLGNGVIVDLFVDGIPVSPITYGRTYEGFLRPGRHVLSVLPTPNAKWGTPSEVILDVQSDRTYSFTAMGDGSGDLILKNS